MLLFLGHPQEERKGKTGYHLKKAVIMRDSFGQLLLREASI
jgi:hypothetical protein